jgi:hypothetical protein
MVDSYSCYKGTGWDIYQKNKISFFNSVSHLNSRTYYSKLILFTIDMVYATML